MEHDFRFFFSYFRNKKQYVEVFLWDVHPTTFAKWRCGRWAYFLAGWESPKSGRFGEIHFVKKSLRFDTIGHELDHVRTEWMWANGITITRKNEERMATLFDQMIRNFLRELRKAEPRIKL